MDPIVNPTRRTLLIGLSALAVAPALVACGSGGTGTAREPVAAPSGDGEEGAFPVTLKHKYGETTFEKAPTRVSLVTSLALIMHSIASHWSRRARRSAMIG